MTEVKKSNGNYHFFSEPGLCSIVIFTSETFPLKTGIFRGFSINKPIIFMILSDGTGIILKIRDEQV